MVRLVVEVCILLMVLSCVQLVRSVAISTVNAWAPYSDANYIRLAFAADTRVVLGVTVQNNPRLSVVQQSESLPSDTISFIYLPEYANSNGGAGVYAALCGDVVSLPGYSPLVTCYNNMRLVDLYNDSSNCGECGNICAANKYCNLGQCKWDPRIYCAAECDETCTVDTVADCACENTINAVCNCYADATSIVQCDGATRTLQQFNACAENLGIC